MNVSVWVLTQPFYWIYYRFRLGLFTPSKSKNDLLSIFGVPYYHFLHHAAFCKGAEFALSTLSDCLKQNSWKKQFVKIRNVRFPVDLRKDWSEVSTNYHSDKISHVYLILNHLIVVNRTNLWSLLIVFDWIIIKSAWRTRCFYHQNTMKCKRKILRV